MIRAERNNNPGNLDAGDHWQGLMPRAAMSPEQAAESRFAVFASAAWGFRALALVLRNYERLHGLNTVRGWITRWAPPGENDTDAYIKAVCSDMLVSPDDDIDLSQRLNLMRAARAIATHESGGWFFSEEDLADGITQAEVA